MEVAVEVLEAVMIIAFGISWPFNVYKSYKSKSTKGKSLVFLVCIELGYVAGITSKIVNPNFNWQSSWWVFMFYVINFVMVLLDLILYFINRNRETKQVKTN